MNLGQYELLGRIAVGGMAEVYRGRAVGEEGFEKMVAIKRILPHFAADTRFTSMLVTEARIHAALSHRNIVQIHDLGISEEGEYFIVLEYVDGRDLAALLSAVGKTPSPGGHTLRLSDAVALYIVAELAEGVHFAHELRGQDGQPLGLIHRDISPTNVLVSYASEVKLLDFGLAKRRTDHSVVGSIKGKLTYMSPEQARRATLDRRSDIFAMGAVLFEMLTGRRLRDINDDVTGWQQVASGSVPSPRIFRPDIPPVLEQLLARALAPDPRDRFADAAAFGAAARQALDQVPRAHTSEADELQALMRTLLPPGSPREQADASKVIRLVSEFIPLDRFNASPLPPAPARLQPFSAAPSLLQGMVEPFPSAPSLAEGGAASVTYGGGQSSTHARPAMGALTAPVPSPTPLLELGTEPTPAPPGVMLPLGAAETGSRSRPLTKVVLATLFVACAAAAGLHFGFAPLPVLRLWLTPTSLEITSQPGGAEVFLDGRRLAAVTPTSITVRRDRRPHLAELRKPGFQPAHAEIRYDRTEKLALTLTLQPEHRPAFEPIPAPPPSAVNAPAPEAADPAAPSAVGDVSSRRDRK